MKKKLLVFASTFPRWENDTNPPFVYELSKRLTSDFDVHVLAPSFPGSKDHEIMDGMKVHRFHYFFKKYEKLGVSQGILPTLKKNKLFYFQVPFFVTAEFFALWKLVKRIQPDIIHAHWIIPQGFISAIIKIITNVPYVVTTHGGDIFALQGKIMNSFKKFTLKNSKEITVVSNAIKKEIETKIDGKLDIKVIPMGVDTKLFHPNKKDISIKKKYNIEGPFLLFVGRLTDKKGVRYLLESMPEIIKVYPKTKLMIIGSGTQENELKKLSKETNIEKNVIFVGAIKNDELPKYYATANIFVSPSIITRNGDREGLPVTIMEAISSGCFVITTNLEGNRDIIDNKNGILIKEKNAGQISKAILNHLKKNNKPSKNTKFDWKKIEKRYVEVLR